MTPRSKPSVALDIGVSSVTSPHMVGGATPLDVVAFTAAFAATFADALALVLAMASVDAEVDGRLQYSRWSRVSTVSTSLYLNTKSGVRGGWWCIEAMGVVCA